MARRRLFTVLNMVKRMVDTNQPQKQKVGVPDENGSFLLTATCRCAECDAVAIVSITAILERFRVDDKKVGIVQGVSGVAMNVQYINFMNGWSLGEDLKPRCPKHSKEIKNEF